MAKDLSESARIILAAAAARPDLHLLPLPTSLKAPPVVIRKTITMLIRTGFVAEVPAGPGESTWEQTETSAPVTLVATPAGLAAIGVEGEAATPAEPATATPQPLGKPGKAARGGRKARVAATAAPKTPQAARRATSGARGRSGGPSKQDTCIALLRRGNGASIPEMMTATGWQSHSVRGFMSGALKKRLRLDVISEKDESGERRYYIAVLRTETA